MDHVLIMRMASLANVRRDLREPSAKNVGWSKGFFSNHKKTSFQPIGKELITVSVCASFYPFSSHRRVATTRLMKIRNGCTLFNYPLTKLQKAPSAVVGFLRHPVSFVYISVQEQETRLFALTNLAS